MTPITPENEAIRLAAVHNLDLVGMPPNERFDRITRTAARLFNVPIALISLVDEHIQWFVSTVGLNICETGRDISFCGHVVAADTMLLVSDATVDPRFFDNPLVTGEPFVRFYAGQPLRSEDGCILGTLCLIDHQPRILSEADCQSLRDLAVWAERELNDATSLRQAAAELSDEQNFALQITRAVGQGITVVDEDLRFRYVNPAYCRIMGYSAEELIGRSPIDLAHPEQHEQIRSIHLRILAGDTVTYEGVRFHASGRRVDTLITLTPRWKDGRITGAIGLTADITERKAMERMKSEFVSTVSHELRTPLTSIRGSLGLLAGGVAGELTPKARAMVEIALKNSERLVRLINDILDIEKIESGLMVFDRKPQPLMPILVGAVEATTAYAAEYGVRIQLMPSIAGAVADVDADRLTQVITNLLSNAIKYSPRGEEVVVSLQRQADRVRLSVADRGPGIPEAFRARIFQKFAQADSSNTRKRGGTGLGLSIVRAIVERLDGTVDFTSNAAAGTIFTVELPAWHPPASTEPARPHVLVADDGGATIGQARVALTGAGFDVTHIRYAADAFHATPPPAALVVELSHECNKQIDLIRSLRDDWRMRDLPIIVIGSDAARAACLEGGAFALTDWLNPPLDQNYLARIIAYTLHTHAIERPMILHIEDDPDITQVVATLLAPIADITVAPSMRVAMQLLEQHRFDLVILDLTLPDGDGAELLPTMRDRYGRTIPVVIFSASDFHHPADPVKAALVKSRASNDSLYAAVATIISAARHPIAKEVVAP